ncbi:hypothetical protein BV20DRAFT_616278 [Pilatotrama ljubarskyi]|nr:hypothetical protein BV20DRAFT_616278 [Pilatotrama ljubarskyi]
MDSESMGQFTMAVDDEVVAILREGRSLSSLLRELVSLRRWKEEQILAKEDERERHERMFTRLCTNCRHTARRWMDGQARVIDDLPAELLDTIFRFALPPNSLLDPASTRSPRSRWALALHAKRNLTEVCWRWRPVAQAILYEEISLRHAYQARALSKAFRGNPELGRLVKKVVVDCPAPPSSETWEVKNAVVLDLVDILLECTSLKTLVFTDTLFVEEAPNCTIEALEFPRAFVEVIMKRAGTLRRVEQWPQGGAHAHFEFPINAILSCTHLVSLTINLNHGAAEKHVVLPFLEELDLSRQYDVPTAAQHNLNHFAKWEMPRLRRLVLPVSSDLYKTFLQKHGRMISYLEFRDHLDLLSMPIRPFCQYIHLCPNLRHFVFDAKGSDFMAANDILPHPTLAYIDIWVNSPADVMRSAFMEMRAKRTIAPQTTWKNVRLLDRALHWVTELPTLFPPDTPSVELPSVHRSPGLSITHTDWGIYRSDLDELYPEEVPPVEDGDTEPVDDREEPKWDEGEETEEETEEETDPSGSDEDEEYSYSSPDESDYEDSQPASDF